MTYPATAPPAASAPLPAPRLEPDAVGVAQDTVGMASFAPAVSIGITLAGLTAAAAYAGGLDAELQPVISATTGTRMRAALDALAAELAALGWTARVGAPSGGRPSLYVRNPEPGAAALSERVYACQRRGDGAWMFWWPWADPIASDVAEAAAVIVRVLRPAGTGAGAAESR